MTIKLTLPPKDPLQCDFCSTGDPVVKAFPCAALTLDKHQIVQGLDIISESPWAACQGCADLIEAEDYEGLARRSLDSVMKKNGWPGYIRPAMKEQILKWHKMFRDHRMRAS
jgi:hypothetical protein